MARIKRWQETLIVAWIGFFSLAWAWPRRTRETSRHNPPAYSQLVVRTRRRAALGVELMAQRPYVRLVRASLVPVSLPLAAGAYVAMASAMGIATPAGNGAAPAPDDAVAAAASSCGGTCNTTNAPCCSVTAATCCNPNCDGCWDVYCTGTYSFRTGGLTCLTCGYGTCPACVP